MTHRIPSFLFPGPVATTDNLSIIHLKRDLQIPVILREHDEDDEGYAEGKVVNTRFGNFPHSTLIGLPWGSQVRASKVDTGSRGRRVKVDELKRKRQDTDIVDHISKKTKPENSPDTDFENPKPPCAVRIEKEAVAATSGFIHLLPPTPENWTSSLPHRTQVVYTPDYSYILHRLRARPGSSLIEAGAGSGSFTHASARAVFDGFPGMIAGNSYDSTDFGTGLGKVWSFEFHEQRHQKLRKEIEDHGLGMIVQLSHRDVCADGFLIDEEVPNSEVESKTHPENPECKTAVIPENPANLQQNRRSPLATAIFLDLPAPWLALPHLTRSASTQSNTAHLAADAKSPEADALPFISALDPSAPVHLCTFSPCIEQVQRTVSVMRRLGWVDIDTVELSHKRYEVRRERIGLSAIGAHRGLQMIPASVEEAVARLIEVEGTAKAYHEKGASAVPCDVSLTGQDEFAKKIPKAKNQINENHNRREKMLEDLIENKSYKEGRLVHRAEPEVKTHTSYLVFAVLPQEWSEADEHLAREKWPLVLEAGNSGAIDENKPMSRKALKKAAKSNRENDLIKLENCTEENFTEMA